jgi:ubiquinone/menaquinone biosynthesis C-methylase UbiE
MRHSHVFDPEHISVLESEDRKIWQNPDEILKAVELKPHFVAADLGCGSGFFTVPLARKVKKVYGIDVQQEMLTFLEEKVKKLRIKNIEPLLSEPNKIPLEDESLDLLISINTLHEFDDREKIIKEMRRAIKKGGRLLIVDFKKEETGFGPPVKIRISQVRAVKLFEEKDFTLSKEKQLPYHYLLVFTKD